MAVRGLGVGHAMREADLADAAVRVLERDGAAALTFRKVATEAGVSPGRVQHYFRNSRGLLAATFRRVQVLVRERVERELSAAGSIGSSTAVVLATLHALVPRDERQRAGLHVAHLVEMQALSDDALAAELKTGRQGLVDFLAGQLGAARDAGEIATRGDLDRTAVRLLALADGLAAMTLVGQITCAGAHSLLDEALDDSLDMAGNDTSPA